VRGAVLRDELERFEISNNIGCDFFELAADGERPPRSAKLVADLDFGSGPGGGDYRKYYLCSDKHRTGWALWEMINDYDTGRPIYARRAWGEPYKGYPAVEAAKRMMLDCLLAESRLWEVNEIRACGEGLLGGEDFDRILEIIEEDAGLDDCEGPQ